MPVKPQQYRRGSQLTASKLNDEVVREIRRERAKGRKLEELARQYRVSTTTISNLVNRSTWSHVSD